MKVEGRKEVEERVAEGSRMPNVESRMSRRKRKGGTRLTEERNLVKLKGWVCCNGNASGEDLQIGYGTVSEALRRYGGTARTWVRPHT